MIVFVDKDLSPSDTEELGGHASGGEQGGRASRADSTEIESLLKVSLVQAAILVNYANACGNKHAQVLVKYIHLNLEHYSKSFSRRSFLMMGNWVLKNYNGYS